MVQYPLRIKQELKDDLIALAAQDDRSLNKFIEKVLKEHVKAQKETKK